ncbi:hypothetical protein H5410_005189 [Solanum commersonii]|uniref:DDE Tnp4 domain-containing protein n=1 Tax=Solanum commersonii TaxID=4109 RepID=A0A9J6A6Q9_SOLCO|nr:hypothetical protein H5410_005189 [Solanum commersonii]
MAPTFIQPKNMTGVHSKIQYNTQFWPWFKDCVGVIDGTYIEGEVPKVVQQAYRNRKGRTSQNVLCACDFDMRFTFVVAGWEDIVAEDVDQQMTQSNNVGSSSRSHDREMQVQCEEIVRTISFSLDITVTSNKHDEDEDEDEDEDNDNGIVIIIRQNAYAAP